MKKYETMILGILSICLIVIVSGCTSSNNNTQSTTPQEPNSVQEKTWHSVFNFTGANNKVSSPFTIKGDKFKIKYSANATDPEFGSLDIYIYRERNNTYFVQWVNLDTSQKNYRDESYVYTGPGSYYLDVGTANLKSWKVEVFDYF